MDSCWICSYEQRRLLQCDSLLLCLCIERKLGVGVGIGVEEGIMWIVAIILFNEMKTTLMNEHKTGDFLWGYSVYIG
jgi:hypothetical protein